MAAWRLISTSLGNSLSIDSITIQSPKATAENSPNALHFKKIELAESALNQRRMARNNLAQSVTLCRASERGRAAKGWVARGQHLFLAARRARAHAAPRQERA